MRNRELVLLLLISACLALPCVALAFVISPAAGWLCAALALLLVGWALGFTLWRYRKIRQLSSILAKAAAGGTVPDVRTNREGELSILQNDLYKVLAALADQADHLRADKRFLANALSDISHQLKTPLTSLMVNSDLLLDDGLPPEKRREFAARISAQLERLRWLVASLLRLSRLDAQVVEMRCERLHLHRLLGEAIEPLLPLAEQKAIALHTECPPGLTWTGDADWTREAVGNLIKNCIEHAPQGGQVLIHCVDNPLHTLLVIEDNGPGFAQQDLPHLFERFYRGGSTNGDGVGIGLALAKSILQTQRSDITAENRPKGGARFAVRLRKQGPA